MKRLLRELLIGLLSFRSRINTLTRNFDYKGGFEQLKERMEYPQTWYIYPFRTKLFQRICKVIIEHEASRTEHGYGGGRHIDHNCRWCDKLIQIPIEESEWAEQNKDLLNLVGKTKKEVEEYEKKPNETSQGEIGWIP